MLNIDTKPSISVLITCHNRKTKTLECLRFLFLQSGLNIDFSIKVFLVDDASKDGTAKSIATHFPQVRIIEGNGNLYWNRGMHMAWDVASKESDPDFYLWLNDDVELSALAISNILNDVNKYNDIICGVLKSKERNNITYGGRNLKGELIEPIGQPQKAYYLNGNVVCIPKKVFEIVGNLDELFVHSIGDFDYGLRARKLGFETFITSNYSGYCESHDELPKWCLPHIPVLKRIKILYSPLGNSHPYYYTRYILRHFGIKKSLINFISIHIRVLFPKLWKITDK
jgi:GT2 family glycosyltransferase